ncbi:DUF2335 domain-containing protein [Actinomycetospora flava]|uniref:DUF2335 domain-containing protein n=1 Tax=Actinomycetospora flava TaxID=3129232 RepID=A0ABU8MF19_9PSEU
MELNAPGPEGTDGDPSSSLPLQRGDDSPDVRDELIEPRTQPPEGGQYGWRLRHETHSGPLPTAESFARYNDGTPDAADRILRMAEDVSAHQIDMERREADRLDRIAERDADRLDAALQAERDDARAETAFMTRGQYLAAGLVALIVVAALVAALAGAPEVAAGFGAAAIIGVATAFLTQRYRGRAQPRAVEGGGPGQATPDEITPTDSDGPPDELER